MHKHTIESSRKMIERAVGASLPSLSSYTEVHMQPSPDVEAYPIGIEVCQSHYLSTRILADQCRLW